MMLPDTLTQLVREVGGDVLLLDARRSRGLITDTAQLLDMLKQLRNAGFTRFIDFTGMHMQTERVGQASRLPSNESTGETPVPPNEKSPPDEKSPPNEKGQDPFQLLLTLRAPEHGHAVLTLKWKYEMAPLATGYNGDGGAGQPGGQPQQAGSAPHPSLSHIWPAAGLAEREIWEMLGIPFSGNENLAPLLLDEQFAGFPLRRDYEAPPREKYAGKLLKQREEQALLDALRGGAP